MQIFPQIRDVRVAYRHDGCRMRCATVAMALEEVVHSTYMTHQPMISGILSEKAFELMIDSRDVEVGVDSLQVEAMVESPDVEAPKAGLAP